MPGGALRLLGRNIIGRVHPQTQSARNADLANSSEQAPCRRKYIAHPAGSCEWSRLRACRQPGIPAIERVAWPHFQAEIPQEVKNELHRAFHPQRRLRIRQKQQIDIAERRQSGTAISAGRRHHQPVLGLDRQNRQRIAEQRIAPTRPSTRHAACAAASPLILSRSNRVLHMRLDAPQLPAEGSQRQHRAAAGYAQRHKISQRGRQSPAALVEIDVTLGTACRSR